MTRRSKGWPLHPVTRASPGTATAVSSRCIPTLCSALITTAFEDALEIAKEDRGYFLDTDMAAEDWRALVAEYKAIVEEEWGKPFPMDVNDQMWGAIGAVFGSWESERAKVYRRLNHIPADWGTAVNVQAMVFGNMGDTSATGVAFTRDPATGGTRLLRRIPHQRAGRGRGRGHPHAAISDTRGA
jgi:hypothetical protein